ncbi:MAG: hypothetical protein H0T73_06355 [Ardenticatenales bacterium]|nr:hypothetical protein [Ardenticatenales bacterium]
MSLITFAGSTCEVRHATYRDNQRLALQLVEPDSGFFIASATINLPEASLEFDETAIRSWAENEGLREVLVAARIVAPPHRYVAAGYLAEVPICCLLGR